MSRQTVALIVVACLFATWGAAQWLFNTICPSFVPFFQLDPEQYAWTMSLFHIAFLLLALPAALFHRLFGYKLGILFALSVFSLGPFLIYPAITRHSYPSFLGAVAVMGAGWAWLETAMNPMAMELGRRETAVRRLNMVQSLYPVGLLIGAFSAQWLLQRNYRLSVGDLAEAVARPYVWIGLGVLMLAFFIERIELPKVAIARSGRAGGIRGEWRSVFTRPAVLVGAMALCAYNLSQAITWGIGFNFMLHEVHNIPPMEIGPLYMKIFLICCVLYAIGRFAGTALMGWMESNRMLALFCIISMALIAVAAVCGGGFGLGCLVASSLFMSSIYPTVFGNAIRDMGAATKLASGVLVVGAGIGSALGPQLMRLVSGTVDARIVTLLALPCLAVIVAFTVIVRRAQSRQAAPPQPEA
jgi:MFS transporter, FHS family, L-fucose permease